MRTAPTKKYELACVLLLRCEFLASTRFAFCCLAGIAIAMLQTMGRVRVWRDADYLTCQQTAFRLGLFWNMAKQNFARGSRIDAVTNAI